MWWQTCFIFSLLQVHILKSPLKVGHIKQFWVSLVLHLDQALPHSILCHPDIFLITVQQRSVCWGYCNVAGSKIKSYPRNRRMAQFLSTSMAVSRWAPHLPNFWSFMWFQAARVTKKEPLKWTLWIRSEMRESERNDTVYINTLYAVISH